uniref:RNF31 ligase n=1 Tax=Macrostomum lignano TaxID=282301 RepID=A0A1I8FSW2_9PLAT
VGDVPPAVCLNFLARMRRISWPMAVVGNVAGAVQDASLELAEVSDASSAAAGPSGVERCACPKEFSGSPASCPVGASFIDTERRPRREPADHQALPLQQPLRALRPFSSGQCRELSRRLLRQEVRGLHRRVTSSQCPHFLNSALQKISPLPEEFRREMRRRLVQARYYGDPARNLPCQPCLPGSATSLMSPGSCHNITGECLRCQNSTAYYCELCTDWMFGDSVTREPELAQVS